MHYFPQANQQFNCDSGEICNYVMDYLCSIHYGSYFIDHRSMRPRTFWLWVGALPTPYTILCDRMVRPVPFSPGRSSPLLSPFPPLRHHHPPLVVSIYSSTMFGSDYDYRARSWDQWDSWTTPVRCSPPDYRVESPTSPEIFAARSREPISLRFEMLSLSSVLLLNR